MNASPELVALLQRYYTASIESDADFLESYVAKDAAALVIGTDDEEWWEGGENVIDVWGSAWRRRGGPQIEGSNPSAYSVGDVGWASDHAYWRLKNGKRLAFRLSVVFVRTEGQWKMVQSHYSVGVPNGSLSDFAE